MATSRVMQIVRGFVGNKATIYNDKLKDGTRSVKIERWLDQLTDADYVELAGALQRAGFDVTIASGWYGTKRLHVREINT